MYILKLVIGVRFLIHFVTLYTDFTI